MKHESFQEYYNSIATSLYFYLKHQVLKSLIRVVGIELIKKNHIYTLNLFGGHIYIKSWIQKIATVHG